jgi:hypothetical protein
MMHVWRVRPCRRVMKYVQLVMGPAGSGKSTFCATIQEHASTVGRTIHVGNMDPAAESFKYSTAFGVCSPCVCVCLCLCLTVRLSVWVPLV